VRSCNGAAHRTVTGLDRVIKIFGTLAEAAAAALPTAAAAPAGTA
jgi:hypothetical protein